MVSKIKHKVRMQISTVFTYLGGQFHHDYWNMVSKNMGAKQEQVVLFYFILLLFFFWNLKDAETQFVSPWWDSGPWPLKLSEFSYCWLLTTFKINILWASLASLIPYCFINKTTFLTKINVLIIVWTPSLWTERINT